MYLHEFQAKALLLEHGVSVAPFSVVTSLDEVEEALKKGMQQAVLKIQVHAGGRGKGGGVKVAKSAEEIRAHAKNLIGMRLVNNQTGPDGVVAEKVLLDTPVSFQKEYYLAVIIDRKNACMSVICSQEGGMEIEEIAAKHPEKIYVEQVPETGRLRLYQLNRLAKSMGWKDKVKEAGIKLIKNVVELFFASDANLIEINPLVLSDTSLIALDAKMAIDDNALFRQKKLAEIWDPTQLTKSEQRAHQHELAYVALEGDIGCMVNGAGLAMATMDLIRYWGGKPANFLDVGGGASEEKVVDGFKILFDDPSVKAVLVNIFGGIMNCEIIAKAFIQAAEHCRVPVVIRMEGTNVVSAKAMLASSGLKVITADSLDEAAQKVCELCR